MTREEALDEAVRRFCARRWWGRGGRQYKSGRTPAELIYQTRTGRDTVNGPVCWAIRKEFREIVGGD